MNTTIEIPSALTDQQSALTASIAEIVAQQEKLANQKLEAETSLSRIAQAVRFLRGESIPLVKQDGARRPMSEQARANIKAGLLASAARKKAAGAAAQAPEAVPVAAPTPATTPKASSGRRATKAA